ncbi:hypothetical protein AVEN_94328-1 [Araneus ventricosus]|uniref:Uncharacterized protein n=1 Tax=Araneus ventricosus TaxID=182803 RepID=A0A4Y2NSD1_ARAVE|nr:hypothetical protein AVEN_94328-1 [Araneus ventricosus]
MWFYHRNSRSVSDFPRNSSKGLPSVCLYILGSKPGGCKPVLCPISIQPVRLLSWHQARGHGAAFYHGIRHGDMVRRSVTNFYVPNNDSLDPLVEEDLTIVFNGLKSGKAPGLDRLDYKMWNAIYDVDKSLLLNVLILVLDILIFL